MASAEHELPLRRTDAHVQVFPPLEAVHTPRRASATDGQGQWGEVTILRSSERITSPTFRRVYGYPQPLYVLYRSRRMTNSSRIERTVTLGSKKLFGKTVSLTAVAAGYVSVNSSIAALGADVRFAFRFAGGALTTLGSLEASAAAVVPRGLQGLNSSLFTGPGQDFTFGLDMTMAAALPDAVPSWATSILSKVRRQSCVLLWCASAC
jgi:hypothetical protein